MAADPRPMPLFEGGRFANPPSFEFRLPGVWSLTKFILGNATKVTAPRVPSDEELDEVLPIEDPDAEALACPPEEGVQLLWVGHATVLCQMGGVTFLTDPVWSDRCSPVQWAGPKRFRRPSIALDALPEIDFVLLSHSHYDHCDLATLQWLETHQHPQWYVPMGMGVWFHKNVVTGGGGGEGRGQGEVDERAEAEARVTELSWWESAEFGEGVTVTAACAKHHSARTGWDKNKTLWCSWAVHASNGASLWFAGDTGYNEDAFRAIGDELGPFSAALIPIGAYEPRAVMRCQHIDPDEAMACARDVQAATAFGIHWGTFVLTNEPITEPRDRILEAVSGATDTLLPTWIVPVHGRVYQA